MEKVETDEKDRPKETIKILATQVFVDPFAEVDEQVRKNKTTSYITIIIIII